MATALTVVNAVLGRLREAQVTDFSAAYSALILQFVNETKKEVEDAWRWTVLRETKTITTSATLQTYTITGSGNRWQFQDKYKRIFDTTNKTWIYPISGDLIEEYKWTTTSTDAQPVNYAVIGQSGGDSQIQLYPIPNGTYSIKLPLYIPQADLVNPADTLTVPDMPIILGTWARAISERGEDQGIKTTDQYVLYQNSLGFYIALDVARVSHETDWTAA
jgi:hypothetical protein